MLTYSPYLRHEETHYSLAASEIARTAQEAIAQDRRTDGRIVSTCRGVLLETPDVGVNGNGPADCYQQPTGPNQNCTMEVQRGCRNCKWCCTLCRTWRQISRIRLRDHHEPDCRGAGEGTSALAQALAYSPACKPSQQETLSRYQCVLAGLAGVWLSVLAHIQSGQAARRERSQR